MNHYKKISLTIFIIATLCACEKNPDAIAKVSPEKKAEIEKCIDKICQKVFITDGGLVVMGNESYGTKGISYSYPIPQEEALKISKNWDYSAPKYYQNNSDGILFNYELDACDVVVKLEKFVTEQIKKESQ